MRTLDQQSSQDTSLWRRLASDGRLLWRIARMAFGYLTVGRRIRKDYKAKQARGEKFFVDEDPSL